MAAPSSKVRLGFGSGKVNDIVTPKDLYDDLNKEFAFDFDPCPLGWKDFIPYIPDADGLKIPWGQSNFINPPFNEIRKWINKGLKEWDGGKKTCVFLIPARTHTATWFRLIWPKATEIRMLSHFGFPGYEKKSPYGVCVVIFKKGESSGRYDETVMSKSQLTYFSY